MAAEQLRRQRLRVATGMVTIGAQEIFERRDVLAPFADDETASVPLQVPRLATILAPRFEPGVRRGRERVLDLRRREIAAIGGIAAQQIGDPHLGAPSAHALREIRSGLYSRHRLAEMVAQVEMIAAR